MFILISYTVYFQEYNSTKNILGIFIGTAKLSKKNSLMFSGFPRDKGVLGNISPTKTYSTKKDS